ncbi:MAG: nucleotidyl transferase AbiEii/AbiGii toxin family protein [Firmicutes bacterium]|nr:nucleotidyl transferase AbiEii/AbiGii toxin family protein [Dethiobacter sp.]MBS3888238.1 nucleotidyl transferase AbiEii/AbiGii toxin family protein [Bacillota bacterium]
MIQTSRQLKALVRNLSKGDSARAQIILRHYAMERFLERIALSKHSNNLILKGGTLVAAMVGLDNRSTMDLDATLKNTALTVESARRIIDEIVSIQIEDGIKFEVMSVAPIMADADYLGVRAILDSTLETMHIPLKIDLSTGDVITPREITYSFKLLFEDRSFSILAYNLETVLAEKLETLLSRGTANTRMRDFYDIYVLSLTQQHNIDSAVLRNAFNNTTKRRGSMAAVEDAESILHEIQSSAEMVVLWKNYQRKFEYATDVTWNELMMAVRQLCHLVMS